MTVIRVTTEVHLVRYDLNVRDPLAVTCPTCGAKRSQPCTIEPLPPPTLDDLMGDG